MINKITLSIIGCLSVATYADELFLLDQLDMTAELNEEQMSFFDGEDIPMVVTPAKLSQPRAQVSSTISVLDGEFIRRSNVHTVEDLLQFVPGFFVGPYDSSSSKVVSYHGTQLDRFRRLQVLINGRSVYSSAYAGVNWALLPISVDDVERVEINRGPNAATYGANSFLAVINIITRSPLETVGGQVKYWQDDAGENALYAQYSALVNDWSMRVSGAKITDKGYDGGDDYDRNDGHEKLNGNVLISHTGLNSTTDFEFGTSSLDGNIDRFTTSGLSYEGEEPYREGLRSYLSATHTYQTSADHELKAQFFYEKSTSDDVHQLTLAPSINAYLFGGKLTNLTGDLVVDLEETRQDIELQSSWVPSTHFSWVNSVLYRVDEAYSKTYFNGGYTENLTRISSSASILPIEQLSLNIGGMWEDSRLSGTYWSPKAGATWMFTPHNSVRLNVSEAYRTPDLFDQQADWSFVFDGVRSNSVVAVNGEEAEHITSYEVGYFHDLPRYGLSFDVMLYREEIDGLVHSNKNYMDRISKGTLEEGNLLDIEIEGIEFEADWRSQSGLLGRLTYATQKTYSTDGKLLDTVPIDTASLLLSYPINERWLVNSSYVYVVGMPDWVYRNVNLWASYKILHGRTNVYELGFGGSKRLDQEAYIISENISNDKDRLYAFANVTF